MSQDISDLQHFFDPKWTLQFENKDICLHDLRIVLFICLLPFDNHFRADLQDFLQKETAVHPRVTITKHLLGLIACGGQSGSYKQLSQSPAHSGSPSRDWQLSEQWFPGTLPLQSLGDDSRLKRRILPCCATLSEGLRGKYVLPFPLYMAFSCQQIQTSIWWTWN